MCSLKPKKITWTQTLTPKLQGKKVQTGGGGLHRTVWALWLFEDPNYYLQVNSWEHVAWGCVASAKQPLYPQSQNK